MNESVESTSTAKNATAARGTRTTNFERVERPADNGRSVVADRPVELRRVEREQGRDLGEEAERVDAEGDTGSRHRDDDASDRGPEDTGCGAEARVEADGVREILGADHLEDERMPRRAADGLGAAHQQRRRSRSPRR